MKFLSVLLCSFMLAAAPLEAAPTKAVQTEKSAAQKKAELNDWIIGLQQEAQRAYEDATKAEEEAAKGRRDAAAAKAALTDTQVALKSATERSDVLQQDIDAQTQALVAEEKARKEAEVKVSKLTKKNNFLATILSLQAAALAVLACLGLRVPNLSPPWGLVATFAAPVVIFGLVKLIL